MITSTIKMNARQFLNIGEDPPGVRLELVNGEVAVSPRPSLDHSYTLVRIARILDTYIDENDLGQLFTDVDTIFGEFDVRCPDLLFVRKNRLRLLKKKAVEVPPDLCIEVVSPTTVHIDRDDKFGQYRDAGIPCYWIIDPIEKTFEAFELRKKEYVLVASAQGDTKVKAIPFPELQIQLAKIWRPSV
jgi:Uma2 family endonuclease